MADIKIETNFLGLSLRDANASFNSLSLLDPGRFDHRRTWRQEARYLQNYLDSAQQALDNLQEAIFDLDEDDLR